MDVRNFTNLIVCVCVCVCVFILEFGIVTLYFVAILDLCHQDSIQIIKYIQNQVSDPSKHYFRYQDRDFTALKMEVMKKS